MAHNGRRRGYGRQKRLYRIGARLGREEQGREAVLGDNRDIPQRASKHGRAERLLRRRVLLQERQHLGPEAPPSLHHKRHELRVRVAVRRVPLALLVGSDARRLASGASVAERPFFKLKISAKNRHHFFAIE